MRNSHLAAEEKSKCDGGRELRVDEENQVQQVGVRGRLQEKPGTRKVTISWYKSSSQCRERKGK